MIEIVKIILKVLGIISLGAALHRICECLGIEKKYIEIIDVAFVIGMLLISFT